MNKISKLLATFALCGLFTISNTSGIEEKIPSRNLAPKSAVSNDIKIGQWYQFDYEKYVDMQDYDAWSLPSYRGKMGLCFNDDEWSCDGIDFPSPILITAYVTTLYGTPTYIYFRLPQDPEPLYLCFGEYTPSLENVGLKGVLDEVSNSSFTNIFKYQLLDLNTTNFNPLIYLNPYPVDNFYAWLSDGFADSALEYILFKGLFRMNSTGAFFDEVQIDYSIASGADYIYNDEIKTVPNSTASAVPMKFDTLWFNYSIHTGQYPSAQMRSYLTPNGIVALPFTYWTSTSSIMEIYAYQRGDIANYFLLSPAYTYLDWLNIRSTASYTPITPIDNGNGGNAFTMAFGVIGQVFASLAGFLNYQVFPGITIGFLLLVPLIITIIVLIFKVVK